MKKKVVSLLLCLSTVALLVGCKTTTTEEPKNIQSEPEVVSEVVEPESEIVEEEIPALTVADLIETTSADELFNIFITNFDDTTFSSFNYEYNEKLDLNSPVFEYSQNDEAVYNHDMTYDTETIMTVGVTYFKDGDTWYKDTNTVKDKSELMPTVEDTGVKYDLVENAEVYIKNINDTDYLAIDIICTYQEEWNMEPQNMTVLYNLNDNDEIIQYGIFSGPFTYTNEDGEEIEFSRLTTYDFENGFELTDDILEAEDGDYNAWCQKMFN